MEILEMQLIPEKESSGISTKGKILIGVTGGIAIGLTAICIPFISPALRKFCLPYIPATNEQVTNVLAALKGGKGLLLDLGSGDGRIVLETAKSNFISHGVELNPWLVAYAKFDAFRKGLSDKTKFYRTDMWTYDVSKYDNVVIFGVEQMMEELERKLLIECKANCNIIACRFPLPNMVPIKIVGHGIDTVWLYNCKKS